MDIGEVRQQLVPLLRKELGSKVELIELDVGNRRHDYLVLLAQLDHPSLKVVIKLAGPESIVPCCFNRTAAIHDLVATRTPIPMQDVVAADESYATWPWRYLIKRHVPGQEWAAVRHQMNAEQLSDALWQIGDTVAQLHTLRFPSFGALAADGRVQARNPYILALKERAACVIGNVRLRDLFLSVLEQYGHLFKDVRGASLCHDDLHGHNILFENRIGEWHLATILDFDKAWAGHHETDLARMAFWTDMTSAPFWRAYERVQTIDSLFQQRRPIYQLLWCLEYARPTPKHLSDTQRVCVELGLSPVENFEI